MSKITFIGAGSTIFAKNVLGDCMLTESLLESEIALYDIDPMRLKESGDMLAAMNKRINNGRAKIKSYCGIENRKEAIKNADFIVTAIQVGGYEPCTVIDFEIPKKYGLRQTIADTLGIGGIFRTLRTLPVFEDIARDIEEYAPNAWLLNYVNPMAMITGFMLRYTGVKTVGLCHSVQVCSKDLLESLGMEDKLEGRKDFIAGINHMAWLLDIRDKNGNDLYPEIKKRVYEKNEKHKDMVRFEYIKRLGYYCTESSEHNAEYNPFFIKSKYPELIDKFNIPLDEYPRRCIKQIEDWKRDSQNLLDGEFLNHKHSKEYGSFIMNAILTNEPYKIGGNILNNGVIENLDRNACVEVPCLVDSNGVQPTYVGKLPVQLAAMNMTNINVQLITIEAHVTKRLEHIYHAAMMDPHTSSELSIDDIVSLCDDLIKEHGNWLPKYK
ncbi:alpha-glucosidase/alpha-galactosidase [Brachyspira hampsonii]|uniref:Alpha-glucosidase/alpha-galactosidase n=1 Tax=Brachyspira hampsonii TaxID=1287055 RepID=A0A1E5NB18_9SPIR|nr:alpha-glucosidase/alpha-galactosidase [Brachyspira hampsonii]OEJ13342.1 alpha-glucosidase/alpha-galactosidase [Brachyspira hampsonii]